MKALRVYLLRNEANDEAKNIIEHRLLLSQSSALFRVLLNALNPAEFQRCTCQTKPVTRFTTQTKRQSISNFVLKRASTQTAWRV